MKLQTVVGRVTFGRGPPELCESGRRTSWEKTQVAREMAGQICQRLDKKYRLYPTYLMQDEDLKWMAELIKGAL